jgi:(E)-4-hydroxy-3-methylbut-2-enyl-diphosphate synthase
MTISRRQTRQVKVRTVAIGGGAPVSVQSMTSTHTHDIDATLQQIHSLAKAGADLVRVAVPGKQDTDALKRIMPASPVPIIADVHFEIQRALEAVEAGAAKIRLNPGTLSDQSKALSVIAACKERGVPIRIGVNEGSAIDRYDAKKRGVHEQMLAGGRQAGLVQIMVDRLAEYVRLFESHGFENLVLAAKSPDPLIVIDAYRAISKTFDYPLHLGVTHAGPPSTGRIRSIAALSALLAGGIGDTVRISYAADPVHEVEDAVELLQCLGLRKRLKPELIACPTCGRIEVDLLSLVEKVQERLAEVNAPIKVAVMGCVVNGPGEAEGADVALFAGKGKAVICVDGKQVRTVDENQMLDALMDEVRRYIARRDGPA